MLKDGELAALVVTDVNKIGAFLDWGELKELMLPYAEMISTPKVGETLVIRKYTDKSGRAAASMKGIYPLLSTNSPYRAGDIVEGRIYEFGHDFGTFVAVDNRYCAMIPKHEGLDESRARIGDMVSARVKSVKEDGKLDLTIKKEKWDQINDDADSVYSLINEYAGVLPFTEKADPKVILRECGMSKAAFKRAVGNLYKRRLIEITKEGIIRKVVK